MEVVGYKGGAEWPRAWLGLCGMVGRTAIQASLLTCNCTESHDARTAWKGRAKSGFERWQLIVSLGQELCHRDPPPPPPPPPPRQCRICRTDYPDRRQISHPHEPFELLSSPSWIKCYVCFALSRSSTSSRSSELRALLKLHASAP